MCSDGKVSDGEVVCFRKLNWYPNFLALDFADFLNSRFFLNQKQNIVNPNVAFKKSF